MLRATRSLPTPLSPRINTVASVSATLSISVRIPRIAGLPSSNGTYSVAYRAGDDDIDALSVPAMNEPPIGGNRLGARRDVAPPRRGGLADYPQFLHCVTVNKLLLVQGSRTGGDDETLTRRG